MERMTRWNPETEEAECEIDGVVHTGSITTRLAEYEDSWLEPEQCAKYAQAEKEGRYIVLKEPRSAGVHRLEEIARADIEGRLVVLPCGDDVTPIKCTGLNCPMQVGKVDPATCKAADTCEWATKPLTNADRIRAMSDEQLADWLKHDRISVCPPDTGHIHCNISDICADRKCWLDWLKQEVKDNG